MARRAVTVVALRWQAYPDVAALQAAVLARVLQTAAAAIETRGEFHLVLAGGSTPRDIYAALGATDTDWSHWHLYFTDERCLPAGDPGRNDSMARSAWLDRAVFPVEQVHAIPAELGPDKAVAAYCETLADVGPFDLTLLGLGEDGHTASLFPGHAPGDEASAPDTLAVIDAPKPPPERVSMSANRLSRSREVLLIVSGAGKLDAVRSLNRGVATPITSVRPASGIDVMLDAAAAGPDLDVGDRAMSSEAP